MARYGETMDMFGAHARRSDPETSKQAAISMSEERVSRLEGLVVQALSELGPATAEEVCTWLEEDKQHMTPRFRPLEEKGLIERSGLRRPNRSGRMAEMWRLTPKGVEYADRNL